MQERNIDALFIVGRENLIYYTGVTEIECMALIMPRVGEPVAVTLWLDSDYIKHRSCLNVRPYFFPKETLVSKVVECILDMGLGNSNIGFEKYFIEFSVFEGLKTAFPSMSFINAGELFYRLRSKKDHSEVEAIEKASSIVCRGMEAAINSVMPGRTELEVLAEAEYAMLKAGSGGSPFRPQVVSGPRTLLAHPCASEKKINEGEIVVIHLGATYQGYCSKMCRSVAVGSVPTEQERIYSVLLEAQERAIKILLPGVTAAEVDEAARQVVEKSGYGKAFLDFIGYGVGLRQSEFYPIIGKGRQDVIKNGMVVDLLLPTIYLKGIGGPRLTDVIHVGESKARILTDYPRELFKI